MTNVRSSFAIKKRFPQESVTLMAGLLLIRIVFVFASEFRSAGHISFPFLLKVATFHSRKVFPCLPLLSWRPSVRAALACSEGIPGQTSENGTRDGAAMRVQYPPVARFPFQQQAGEAVPGSGGLLPPAYVALFDGRCSPLGSRQRDRAVLEPIEVGSKEADEARPVAGCWVKWYPRGISVSFAPVEQPR